MAGDLGDGFLHGEGDIVHPALQPLVGEERGDRDHETGDRREKGLPDAARQNRGIRRTLHRGDGEESLNQPHDRSQEAQKRRDPGDDAEAAQTALQTVKLPVSGDGDDLFPLLGSAVSATQVRSDHVRHRALVPAAQGGGLVRLARAHEGGKTQKELSPSSAVAKQDVRPFDESPEAGDGAENDRPVKRPSL
jgi:hypothetical protein